MSSQAVSTGRSSGMVSVMSFSEFQSGPFSDSSQSLLLSGALSSRALAVSLSWSSELCGSDDTTEPQSSDDQDNETASARDDNAPESSNDWDESETGPDWNPENDNTDTHPDVR